MLLPVGIYTCVTFAILAEICRESSNLCHIFETEIARLNDDDRLRYFFFQLVQKYSVMILLIIRKIVYKFDRIFFDSNFFHSRIYESSKNSISKTKFFKKVNTFQRTIYSKLSRCAFRYSASI